MTNPAHQDDGRSRRAVVRVGMLALVVLFVVGAVVMVPTIQRDLGKKANAQLVEAGIDARIDFHGQDGTLRCARRLDDPESARAIAHEVDGVRSVTLDVSCVAPTETLPIDTTVPPPVPTSTTVAPPTTTAAPSTATSTTTTAATTTTVAVDPTADSVVAIGLIEGRFNLSGRLATGAQRAALIDAAAAAVGADNVTDEVTLDSGVGIDADAVAGLATLVAAMPLPLVDGVVGWGPNGLYATGVYIDDAARDQFQTAATDAGATTRLVARPIATAADAAIVQQDLNALVADEPFVFGKGSTDVSPDQQALLHRVAGTAKRFAGMVVEVQGHTDSEGDAGRNLTLSEQRAKAVADAMIALGVPSANITSKGFGETDLITDDNGVEIPEKSRRVVFGVSVSN